MDATVWWICAVCGGETDEPLESRLAEAAETGLELLRQALLS